MTNELWMVVIVVIVVLVLCVQAYQKQAKTDDILAQENKITRHDNTSLLLFVNLLASVAIYAIIMRILTSQLLESGTGMDVYIIGGITLLLVISAILKYHTYMTAPTRDKFILWIALAEIPAIAGLIWGIMNIMVL